MENVQQSVLYPFLHLWDVDKYQSQYPPDHWNLCRLFMLLNQTKYSETRLVQLTEAFYKKGVYGLSTDPKTDRIVVALTVPVIEHLLESNPGIISHPFTIQDKDIPIDSAAPRAESIQSSIEQQNPSLQDDLKRIRSAEQQAFAQDATNPNKQLGMHQGDIQLTRQVKREENFDSSKFIPSLETKQHYIEKEKQVSLGQWPAADPTSSSNRKRGPDFQTSSGVPDSKQMRLEPLSPDKVALNEHYRIQLWKAMDINSMKRLFIGLVIIHGVTKDSKFCNDIEVLEESFNRSKFGPCTWVIEKIDDLKKLTGIKLQWRDNILVEAEGRNIEFMKRKVAAKALDSLAEFSPVIRASKGYFNNGRCRELPLESPKGPCWHYVNDYTNNYIKELIDRFANKKDYLEMIVLHHPEKKDEFCMQDIIEYIEKETANKLRYRTAEFLHQTKRRSAICISYNHSGLDLYEWLKKKKDQRYFVSLKKTFEEIYRNEFERMAHENIPDATTDGKSNGNTNLENCNNNTGATNNHQYSGATNTLSGGQSSLRRSYVEDETSKQPPPLASPSTSGAKGLTWLGKEHLSKLSKSVYIVKMVKEDSTTENDPFNLLKSTCSLMHTIDFKFIMDRCDGGLWQALVLLSYDRGNILVGEAKANNCSDARLFAGQDAINTIQSYCRIVEPNFNYFAEGGIPTFISLKYPMKTPTYEIMNMDTRKIPLDENVASILLKLFIEDKVTEDIFFLSCDFTSAERECVRKMCKEFGLGWRLFGMRARNAKPGEMSTQHLCVFQPKTPVELVKQTIVSGGTSEKYCVVTCVKPPIPQRTLEEGEVTTPSQPRILCDTEFLPGGCVNPECAVDHVNILDNIVNQYLGLQIQ